MKISTSVSERMRDMLTRDKVGMTDGFAAAMKGDIMHVFARLFRFGRRSANLFAPRRGRQIFCERDGKRK